MAMSRNNLKIKGLKTITITKDELLAWSGELIGSFNWNNKYRVRYNLFLFSWKERRIELPLN